MDKMTPAEKQLAAIMLRVTGLPPAPGYDIDDDVTTTRPAANGLAHTEVRRAGSERIGRADG